MQTGIDIERPVSELLRHTAATASPGDGTTRAHIIGDDAIVGARLPLFGDIALLVVLRLAPPSCTAAWELRLRARRIRSQTAGLSICCFALIQWREFTSVCR